jgi:protein TonB
VLASDEYKTPQSQRPSFAAEIVELVVFSSDDDFLQTLKGAVGSARRLWHVPSADKVGDLLVAGQVGILVLDVGELGAQSGSFIAHLKRQFPHLVLVVAGSREAEISLANLISAGTIYRFIHKPMSPGRARLFADAAVKKYLERRDRLLAPPARVPFDNRRLWAGAAIGLLALGIVGLWALRRNPDSMPAPTTAAEPATGRSALTARAAAALAADRLTSSSGDGALDLYRAALARDPDDAEARAGLAKVRELLLARADRALLEEHVDAAASAIEIARQAGVDGGQIEPLAAKLAALRERLKGPPVQQHVAAARPGRHEPAPTARSPDAAGGTATAANSENERQRLAEQQRAAAESAAASAADTPPPGPQPARQEPVSAVAGESQAATAGRPIARNRIAASELTLLKSVKPVYPVGAQREKTEGWVELDFTVATGGEVKDIEVHAADPPKIFENSAVKALAQWRYKSVLQDGEAVEQPARVRIRFALAE